MRIGIDFDNTLACYEPIFTKLAQERGFIGSNERASKQGLRQLIRRKENGEQFWQQIQGKVYGLYMQDAEQFIGEDRFLRRCAATPGLEIFIVSHKTKFGHFDETRTNLRDAAYLWMCNQGFFDPMGYAIPQSHLFFESTQQEKLARIADLNCDIFIDDLIELFCSPSFPQNTKRILFSNTGNGQSIAQVDAICASWQEIEVCVFGN